MQYSLSEALKGWCIEEKVTYGTYICVSLRRVFRQVAQTRRAERGAIQVDL